MNVQGGSTHSPKVPSLMGCQDGITLSSVHHKVVPQRIQTCRGLARSRVTRPARAGFAKQSVWLLSLAVVTMGLIGSPDIEGSREGSRAVFREDFSDLAHWRAWEFDKVDRATRYDIRQVDGNFLLRMEADRSASGLILTRNYPVQEGVQLRWRWKADLHPAATDPLRRQGDDYAVRVYVIFEQDAADAGWLERWVLRKSPFRNEGILPERSLAYAWTSIAGLPDFYPNPYTDRVAVFPVEMDASGEWREILVTPVADYRRAFGKDPPAYFRLAVMSDADDSQSRALAWLDFIEIRLE